jgi:hypothetical protein
MAELGRVCGSQADLFRAILARISHLNKLPVGPGLCIMLEMDFLELRQREVRASLQRDRLS